MIEELGLGQLRMSYTELYDLIPRAFWNAVDGYYLTEQTKHRKEWEMCRWQTCCLINIQLPRNKQISLQKLVKFEWEKESSKIDSYDKTLLEYEKMLKRKNAK